MSKGNIHDRDVTSLLRDLEAARTRIASVQSRGGETAIKALALCDAVDRLCHEAAISTDKRQIRKLLAKSRAYLDDLQRLLGLH